MTPAKALLEIFEANHADLLLEISRRFQSSTLEELNCAEEDCILRLAWSFLDPIHQSLRYDNDYLFRFFLDYSSKKWAAKGLTLESSIGTLNILGDVLKDTCARHSPPDVLFDNLNYLTTLLGKGVAGIATNFMHQRDQLLDELRRTNVRLIEQSRHRLDFMAGISHELKTPLTSVIAYSEQLKYRDLPPETRASFIEVIYDQSNKLLQLIDDLLDISRSENENSQLNLKWSHLIDVLEEAVSTVAVRATEKNINLILEPVERLPRVHMDPLRIQQVVWNILTNAVKYSEGDSDVMISASRQGEMLQVAIKDHGIGIKPRDLDRIFGSFHQTHDALAMAEGGAGLGLGIVRHYLNLHGGEIEVESSYGEGSTFTFSIPINGPDLEAIDEDSPIANEIQTASPVAEEPVSHQK
jgi:signal transduction histidine kinase